MNFSIPMAFVDYIPVAFFAIASIFLMRDLYNKMSKGAFALFSGGLILVFMAGFLKASYKLLYAAGICDFEVLSQAFFLNQSTGFLLAGIGLVAMMCHKQEENKINGAALAAPVLFSGTMIFVSLTVVGLGLMDAILCILAGKLKKPAIIVIFVISFVGALGMGYLSSKDFANANMNWIAEGVNCIAQGSLLLGTWFLHKNGLKELPLHKN